MIINGVLQALAVINSSVEREANEQNHEVNKKKYDLSTTWIYHNHTHISIKYTPTQPHPPTPLTKMQAMFWIVLIKYAFEPILQL